MIYSKQADGEARLQSYIDGLKEEFEPIYLTPGEYHIRGSDKYVNMNLASNHIYGAQIFVHEAPLLPHHNSEIKGITFRQTSPTVPLLRLDHSTRSKIHHNYFRAETAWDGTVPVELFERQGTAIQASEASVSEDNWKVEISDNLFEWFAVGIETSVPSPSSIPPHRIKGTSRWKIADNDFDGCWTALKLIRPEIFQIHFNHIQLHRHGIAIAGGKSNWLFGNDFERGVRAADAWDIVYDGETCNNLAFGNTARRGDKKVAPSISPEVKSAKLHNQYARQIRKLVIWADCSKGE